MTSISFPFRLEPGYFNHYWKKEDSRLYLMHDLTEAVEGMKGRPAATKEEKAERDATLWKALYSECPEVAEKASSSKHAKG